MNRLLHPILSLVAAAWFAVVSLTFLVVVWLDQVLHRDWREDE